MKALPTLASLITVGIILGVVSADGTEPPKTEVKSYQQEEPESFIAMIESNLDEPLANIGASIVRKFSELQDSIKKLFSKKKEGGSKDKPAELFDTLPDIEAAPDFKISRANQVLDETDVVIKNPSYHRYKRPLVSYAVRVPIMTK